MGRVRPGSRVLVVLLAFCGLTFTSRVGADDLKGAEKLYGAAAKDMAAGKYDRACPTFEAAKEKAPEHVRTGMTLAQCYTEWGKPGSAFEELRRVREFARLQNKQDKVAAIDDQIATLDKRAPILVIRVPAEIEGQAGLSIVANGTVVAASRWNARVPVNPGTYRIEATAVGKEPWTTSVDVKEPGKTVTVSIAPAWATAGAKTGDGAQDGAPNETSSLGSSPSSSSSVRTLGFVGLGLGGAGLVVGGILGGLAISKNDEGAAYCNAQNACQQAGYDLRQDAYKFGNGSTAAFVVGGVLAATGIVLVAIGGKNKRVSDEAQTSLWVGPTSVGLRARW